MTLAAALILAGCSAREVNDSLAGSTAQRLVTYSIDEMVTRLSGPRLDALKGRKLYLETHFLAESAIKAYADERLRIALTERFGASLVDAPEHADQSMSVFYTSLGTDQSQDGFFLPLGYVPGVDQRLTIDLITVKHFHGIAEMYYYIGETGIEFRSDKQRAVIRTDVLGLPIIELPISDLDN